MAMLIYLKTAFRFFNTFLIKLGLLDGIYGYKKVWQGKICILEIYTCFQSITTPARLYNFRNIDTKKPLAMGQRFSISSFVIISRSSQVRAPSSQYES